MDPDEYDRVVGISSVDLSSEEDRFGDKELTDTENPVEGVANNSGTPMDSHSGIGSRPVLLRTRRGVVPLVQLRSLTDNPALMPLLPANLRVQLNSYEFRPTRDRL